MIDSVQCAECGVDTPIRAKGTKYCSKKCLARAAQKRAEERRKAALRKIDRLAIAAAVAPGLRTKKPRRVIVTNKEGKPIRETTDRELALSMLKRVGIELSVEKGIPEAKPCESCGRAFKPLQGDYLATTCLACRNGWCTDCACPLLSPKTLRRSKVTGLNPLCRKCSSRRRRTREVAMVCAKCGGPYAGSSDGNVPEPNQRFCRPCFKTSRAKHSDPCTLCRRPIVGYARQGMCTRCYMREYARGRVKCVQPRNSRADSQDTYGAFGSSSRVSGSSGESR